MEKKYTFRSELITGKTKIWEKLTAAAINSSKSFVAVAYFSKNAAQMLPLVNGSILVVDASENAVKTGQTCPEELIKLEKLGVKVFSFTGLHAKVFVFDNVLYIGSTNASAHSANYLEEAILKMNEKKVVKESVAFIKSLLIKQLTQTELIQLNEIYKSPKFFAPKSNKTKNIQNGHEQLVYVVKLRQLKRDFKNGQDDFERGKKEAEKKIQEGQELEAYRHIDTHKPKIGDIVIRITKNDTKTFVSPSATIINIKKIKNSNRIYVYVAAQNVKEKSLKEIEKKLGSTELIKAGVKNSSLAARINSMWI
jgi:hypothetical protein